MLILFYRNDFFSVNTPMRFNRLAVSTNPHMDNMPSLGVEVYGTANHFCATLATFRFFLHSSATIIVETTGFRGAGHAVETMDAYSKDPLSPVKIYLDEIDKLGNYESISPYWCLHIFPSNISVAPNPPWLLYFLGFNGIVRTFTCPDI